MLKRNLNKFYRHTFTKLIKPLVFAPSPDTIHRTMISATSLSGKIWPIRKSVGQIFGQNKNPVLSQELHGIKFSGPVGLAAGFDKNGEVVPMMAQLGFGFSTVGSVTARKCIGNPKPWFYRLPKTKSLVVNAGLANHGSDIVISRLLKYRNKISPDFPVVLSIAKTNSNRVVDINDAIQDYVISVRRAKDSEMIKTIEVNISCPNAFGGEPFSTPERLKKLLRAIQAEEIDKPLFIKMPSDMEWSMFEQLLDVAVRFGVAGVTISNLAKDRSRIDFKDPLPGYVKGNFSGKPTFELSNELIRYTYKKYGDKLTIIGSGGIFTPEDAYIKIKLGSSLVEVLTGMIFCGPQLATEINHELSRLLQEDGYNHISEAVGVEA